ncbi:DEAD/DEAH box helicase [Lamprobacter modestohalophilus]|uniref:DEAD/DEAH box helicase n=1 Tax=Lamprobacter modestohalophilus TaxID=1064514 RepID=UPI002ADEB5BC|nr:DEAD/DEAH box helicase [Lamprobacter modestohalophilus]MEA1052711.1 DEAD/DEAH box helicase [Lamprobacter modestohalophilus]
MSILDIRSAIRAELEATPEYYDFKVKGSVRDGHLWRVEVEPGSLYAGGAYSHVVLDDSFEGASAWWAGAPNGTANILTVITEDDQIILKDASTTPPKGGHLIRLYPPRYLQALADVWAVQDWSIAAFDCLADLGKPTRVEANPLSGHAFRWLRRAQSRALKLVHSSSAFLWGPPGTGKTTTLGVLLAEYLYVNPRSRVLLLSTTNHAVDQATVAVDKALEAVNRFKLRHTVKRLGTRFVASHYADREHLLPVIDRELIRRLARVEAERPPSSDIAAYSDWVERVERLRKAIRDQSMEVLRSTRLVSMTITRALFSLADLRELPVFDLIVFDEASQVGLASALALMPLGRARVFAGDPKQLSPVVRSSNRHVQRWLARSPFAEKPSSGSAVCLLDEQSRMAASICQVVSQLFYRGKLTVAANACRDKAWLAEREVALGTISADEQVSLQHVPEAGSWSQRYQGPIRYRSAEMIAELVESTGNSIPSDALVILTPFRAQRALLRQQLSKHGVKRFKVSTIHRAQGSEAPIVIFDPVDGSNKFLLSEEARRLINVALSRAQAKIVVFLSDEDHANPLFAQLSNIVRLSQDHRPATEIADLAEQTDFPHNAMGLRVLVGAHSGEVVRIADNDEKLWILSESTGAEHCFLVDYLRRIPRARQA